MPSEERMKQILRLLIIILIVVGIGWGVYALFFKKDNDTQFYETTTAMMNTLEERQEDCNPGMQVYDVQIYNDCFSVATSASLNIVDSMDLLGNRRTLGVTGSYGDIHTAQWTTIKYYYSLLQFADEIRLGDVKSMKNKVNDLNTLMDQIATKMYEVKTYQETINKASETEKDALYIELSNMYDSLIDIYKTYLQKENNIAFYMKDVVTAYALDGQYLYDAKGATLESFLYQSSLVLEHNKNEDVFYAYLDDMYAILQLYTDDNQLFFSEKSAAFTTSYQNMVSTEEGKQQLKRIFAIAPDDMFLGKEDIIVADPEQDLELFAHYGFSSQYYQDVINIVKFLFEV